MAHPVCGQGDDEHTAIRFRVAEGNHEIDQDREMAATPLSVPIRYPPSPPESPEHLVAGDLRSLAAPNAAPSGCGRYREADPAQRPRGRAPRPIVSHTAPILAGEPSRTHSSGTAGSSC